MSAMIAVIGAGKMGEALVAGLLSAGTSPDELLITERYDERAHELTQRYGVKAVTNSEAAQLADTVVVAVKPQDMNDLLAELSEVITPDHLLVTIAAGITTGAIEEQLAAGVPVVRVMPNTPALVGAAMSAVAAGAHASRRASRSGRGIVPAGRQGDPGARVATRRRHRVVRQRSGLHLLRRRSDD